MWRNSNISGEPIGKAIPNVYGGQNFLVLRPLEFGEIGMSGGAHRKAHSNCPWVPEFPSFELKRPLQCGEIVISVGSSEERPFQMSVVA